MEDYDKIKQNHKTITNYHLLSLFSEFRGSSDKLIFF